MTFNDVLNDYLAHLRAGKTAIFIGWDTVQQWPDGALEAFLKHGLLISAPATKSIECNGCENHCFMDVIKVTHDNPAKIRAFIVCDDAEMQDEMGRIIVPLVRLQQWQGSVRQLANVVAGMLKLPDKIKLLADQSFFKLGMLKSPNGRRWITLNPVDLSIEINGQNVPVEEILFFDNQELVIDQDRVDGLLHSRPIDKSKKYVPNTTKREIRKLTTQAMHQDWNDELLKLKEQHPGKSNTWYAAKISKMEIAKDKSEETIRKNMVK
jgi:hypothetical protein